MGITNQFTSDQNPPPELAPDWTASWSVFFCSLDTSNVYGLLLLGL